MNPNDDLSPELRRAIETVKATPPRREQAAARGRANFLVEAEMLRQQPVSQNAFWRHIGQNLFPRKEKRMSALVTLMLVLGIAMGGTGATVYAAQDASPTNPLYAVKLLSEDVRVSLEGNAQARANLEIEFANRRSSELANLESQDSQVAAQVKARQQSQIEEALKNAANLDDASLTALLEQARDMLQTQLQTLDQTQTQTRDMLTERLRMIEEGLQNLEQFRARIRETQQQQNQPRPGNGTPPPTVPVTGTVPTRPGSLPPPNVPPTTTVQARPSDVPPPPPSSSSRSSSSASTQLPPPPPNSSSASSSSASSSLRPPPPPSSSSTSSGSSSSSNSSMKPPPPPPPSSSSSSTSSATSSSASSSLPPPPPPSSSSASSSANNSSSNSSSNPPPPPPPGPGQPGGRP